MVDIKATVRILRRVLSVHTVVLLQTVPNTSVKRLAGLGRLIFKNHHVVAVGIGLTVTLVEILRANQAGEQLLLFRDIGEPILDCLFMLLRRTAQAWPPSLNLIKIHF